MKTFFQLLLALGLAAGIVALSFLPEIPIEIGGHGFQFSRSARVAEARQKLHELEKSYMAEVTAYTVAAEREIGELCADAEDHARSTALSSTAGFQGFSNMSNCVLLGTKDQLTGQGNLQHYTAQAMAPSVRLLSRLRTDLQAVLDAHHHSVTSATNRLQRDTLAVAETFALSPQELPAPQFKGMVSPVSSAVMKNRGAALAVSLEVILIKSTLSMIQGTLKHLIARQVGALTAAGGAALVDGPIPVGDAIGATIAVVGTAWTALDVHSAVRTQSKMPGRVEAALREQIDSLEEAACQALRPSETAGEKIAGNLE